MYPRQEDDAEVRRTDRIYVHLACGCRGRWMDKETLPYIGRLMVCHLHKGLRKITEVEPPRILVEETDRPVIIPELAVRVWIYFDTATGTYAYHDGPDIHPVTGFVSPVDARQALLRRWDHEP